MNLFLQSLAIQNRLLSFLETLSSVLVSPTPLLTDFSLHSLVFSPINHSSFLLSLFRSYYPWNESIPNHSVQSFSHNNHEIPTNIKQPYSQEIRNFRTYATRAEAVAELLILTIIYKHLLLPSGRKLLGSLVVTSQTMNTTLHHNQTELGVTILSVTLQVLSDSHSLLDQEVHILRKRRSKS